MTESEERQVLLTYQQIIVNAFRDVSKSLVAYRKYREYREQQEQLTASARDAARLSQALYQEGQDSYLEVLTSDTNYFTAELNLAIARQNELLSLVQLYNALGGGWKTK
jgi:multidrug efflux system outer membrane protein